jgi:hypothetical protein
MQLRRSVPREQLARGVWALTVGVGLFGLAYAAGCKSDPACSAGARDCVTDSLARICMADGSGWVTESCAGGTCKDGVCQVPCKAGEAQCADDRVALVCSGTPAAWVAVSCRATEKCDAGACKLDPAALACTPGKKDCATDGIARVCAKDGSEWEHSACAPGYKCDLGDCKFDGAAACTPGTGTCANGTPYRCRDGTGYDSTPCPSGTTCAGAGLCQGAVCTVGTARCMSGGTFVESCPDGSGLVQTPCAKGELCVDATAVSVAGFVSTCRPAACTPGQTACGNPSDASVDPTKAFSTCVATASGFAWQKTSCGTYATCSSTAPGCTTQCRPGETTCSADGKYVVTCGPDGKYALTALTACTTGKQCVTTTSGKAACGDAACAAGVAGACTADGKVLACDAAGSLATSATACTNGTCSAGKCAVQCQSGQTACKTMPDGTSGIVMCSNGVWGTTPSTVCATAIDATKACVQVNVGTAKCGDALCKSATGSCNAAGKFRPCVDGALVDDAAAVDCAAGQICLGNACVSSACQTGESMCVAGSEYRSCTGGKWSATVTACPAAGVGVQACLTTTSTSGARTAVCGAECMPGARTCVPPTGAGPSTSLRVCGTDAKWSAPQGCVIGSCVGTGTNADYCASQCVPGDTVCGGSTVAVPGVGVVGTTSTTICSASGTLPTTYTTCAAGTYCRKDDAGRPLGCVECVGGRNESGYTDTRCTPAAPTSFQTCSATNTWTGAASTSCNTATCVAATSGVPASCTSTNKCVTCYASANTAACSSSYAACTTATCIAFRNCLAGCSTSACLSACYGAAPADSQTVSYANCEFSACVGGCP